MRAIVDVGLFLRTRLEVANEKRDLLRAVAGGHWRRRGEEGSKTSGASVPGSPLAAPGAVGSPVRLAFHEAALVVLRAHLLAEGVGRKRRKEACQGRHPRGWLRRVRTRLKRCC